MKKITWSVLVGSLLTLVITTTSSAQVILLSDSENAPTAKGVESGIPFTDESLALVDNSGIESCFSAYPYGKVNFELAVDKISYQSGERITISGNLINISDVPIADASLWLQLSYISKAGPTGNILGTTLLDMKKATRGLFLPPNSQVPVSFDYNLPRWLPTGQYLISSYLIVSDQYNISGLSFTPDIYGDFQVFRVTGDRLFDLPYFDLATTYINGQKYNTNMPALFVTESPVVIEMPLINPTSQSRSVRVIKKLYHWDDVASKNFITEEEQSLNVPAKSQVVVSYQTPQLDGGTYMVDFVAILTDGSQTFGRVRFNLPGERLRLIYSGLSAVPTTKDQTVKVTTCFSNETHSVGTSNENSIKVSLLDDGGESLLSSTNAIKDFSADVKAITQNFIYNADKPQDLDLVIQLYRGDELLDEVRTSYRVGGWNWMMIAIFVILAAIVIIYLLVRRRDKIPQVMVMILASGLVLGVMATKPTNTGLAQTPALGEVGYFNVNIKPDANPVYATISVQTGLSMTPPSTTWSAGGTYDIGPNSRNVYNATGGTLDSPDFEIVSWGYPSPPNSRTVFRNDMKATISLPEFLSAWLPFVPETIDIAGSSNAVCATEWDYSDGDWGKFCLFRNVNGNPAWANRSNDNPWHVISFPSLAWQTPNHFKLHISSNSIDTLTSNNSNVSCDAGTLSCTVSPTAPNGSATITWRRDLIRSYLGSDGITWTAFGTTYLKYGNTTLTNVYGDEYRQGITPAGGWGLIPGTTNGYSISDTESMTVTIIRPTTPPGAPTDLQVINTTPQAPCGGSIYLSWAAPTTGGAVTGYKIFRDGIQIATTTPQLTYLDSGLTPNSTHSYFVKAYNNVGDSAPSNTTDPITASDACVSPPGGGGGVTGSNYNPPVISCESIQISWPAATGEGVVYDIDRRIRGAGGGARLVTGWTINSYTDTGLTSGAEYKYDVMARNSAGTLDYGETPDWIMPSSAATGCGTSGTPPDGGGSGTATTTPEPDRREGIPSLPFPTGLFSWLFR